MVGTHNAFQMRQEQPSLPLEGEPGTVSQVFSAASFVLVQ